MSTTKILTHESLDEQTKAKLAHTAQEHGLSLDPRSMNKPDMIKAILEASAPQEIDVSEGEATSTTETPTTETQPFTIPSELEGICNTLGISAQRLEIGMELSESYGTETPLSHDQLTKLAEFSTSALSKASENSPIKAVDNQIHLAKRQFDAAAKNLEESDLEFMKKAEAYHTLKVNLESEIAALEAEKTELAKQDPTVLEYARIVQPLIMALVPTRKTMRKSGTGTRRTTTKTFDFDKVFMVKTYSAQSGFETFDIGESKTYPSKEAEQNAKSWVFALIGSDSREASALKLEDKGKGFWVANSNATILGFVPETECSPKSNLLGCAAEIAACASSDYASRVYAKIGVASVKEASETGTAAVKHYDGKTFTKGSAQK